MTNYSPWQYATVGAAASGGSPVYLPFRY